jgi:hypothetical protein
MNELTSIAHDVALAPSLPCRTDRASADIRKGYTTAPPLPDMRPADNSP